MAVSNSSVFHSHPCAEKLKDTVTVCTKFSFSDPMFDVGLEVALDLAPVSRSCQPPEVVDKTLDSVYLLLL